MIRGADDWLCHDHKMVRGPKSDYGIRVNRRRTFNPKRELQSDFLSTAVRSIHRFLSKVVLHFGQEVRFRTAEGDAIYLPIRSQTDCREDVPSGRHPDGSCEPWQLDFVNTREVVVCPERRVGEQTNDCNHSAFKKVWHLTSPLWSFGSDPTLRRYSAHSYRRADHQEAECP
jgi:hypothetical protein